MALAPLPRAPALALERLPGEGRSLRAHHDPDVRRHALQLDAHAQPGRPSHAEGRRCAGAGVHPARPARLLASAQVLPLLAIRAHVHGAGGRDVGHPGVSLHVSGGQVSGEGNDVLQSR